jgi:predicted metal-binding membrane protein
MVAMTTAIAWWFLLSMAGAVAEFRDRQGRSGPGMSLIASSSVDAGSFAATIANLCLSADPARCCWPVGLGLFAALLIMWLAMAAAMMLPTAAPMIRTYAEIADTAAARGDPVVHPLVLTAGYLYVWALAAWLLRRFS